MSYIFEKIDKHKKLYIHIPTYPITYLIQLTLVVLRHPKTFMGTSAASIHESWDIIFEILSWLPRRSLMRFKSSCKLWHSVIYDPYFMTIKLSCCFGGTSIIFTSSNSTYYYSLEFKSSVELSHPSMSAMKTHESRFTSYKTLMFFSIVSSLDSLLLYNVGVFSDEGKFVQLYYLYNPITTHFKFILTWKESLVNPGKQPFIYKDLLQIRKGAIFWNSIVNYLLHDAKGSEINFFLILLIIVRV